MNRGAWQAAIHGVARVGHNLATKPQPPPTPNFSFTHLQNNDDNTSLTQVTGKNFERIGAKLLV